MNRRIRSLALSIAPLLPLALAACGGDDTLEPVPSGDASAEGATDAGADEASDAAPSPIVLGGAPGASVEIDFEPLALHVRDAAGKTVLETAAGSGDDAYGFVAATVDRPIITSQSLPGWDGYVAQEDPWKHATSASVLRKDATSVDLALEGAGFAGTLSIGVVGGRVRLHFAASAPPDAGADGGAPNKTTIAFALPSDEHFFGLGERFATVDHRGWSLYSWCEEGALGAGEDVAPSSRNPYPNGPSMTYFPIPFLLSSKGYGVSLGTTFRSEVHLGSERGDGWRAAVNAPAFDATIYVHDSPLDTLGDYTEDVGRPRLPIDWAFGVQRRVDENATVNGVDEATLMRTSHLAVTVVDDTTHFLPAASQKGREDVLAAWTSRVHAMGYKVFAYNNAYVAEDRASSADEYAYGKAHGLFVKGPDGEPELTQFISGALLTIATVDFTNPEAVAWYGTLLQRTIDLGYDGWMHDFGEYVKRDAVFFDGRRGDEMHDEFPVLYAKAAHDYVESVKPGQIYFYARSGYTGSSQWAPGFWQGDAEATFDETLGLPSAVRAGLNESMSGVPYWGSDVTGFKCLTKAPNDKEVFERWVEFGAVSPLMLEENACSNPLDHTRTKWKLWNDQQTIDHYRGQALLHTRLAPYFWALSREAHRSGRPITMHPFLLFPTRTEVYSIDDSFFLGSGLYASPVVRRGVTSKTLWLPPGRYVRLDDGVPYEGDHEVTVDAPLGRSPLFLVAGQVVPMLDASIDTLGETDDATVVTPARVADRLDAIVALGPGATATFTLADGTTLEAARGADQGDPDHLAPVTSGDVPDCASCVATGTLAGTTRVQANGALAADSTLRFGELTLRAHGGPARRVRWDVRLLP